MKALAKQREDRYQSAAAMRADIERYLAGLPSAAGGDEGATELMPRAAAAAAAPEPTDDALALPADEEEQQRRRRRWTLVAVLGVLALILAGVIGWLVFRGNPEDEKVSVPSVVGLQRAAAETALQDKGLEVEVKTQNDAAAPRNEVTEQDPEAGAFLVPGSTVTHHRVARPQEDRRPGPRGAVAAGRRRQAALGRAAARHADQGVEHRSRKARCCPATPRPASRSARAARWT